MKNKRMIIKMKLVIRFFIIYKKQRIEFYKIEIKYLKNSQQKKINLKKIT